MILLDPIREYPWSKVVFRGGRKQTAWCHMAPDSGITWEEFHCFARYIGLKRAWFQGDHYDLTPKRKVDALSAGALDVGPREFMSRRKRIRRGKNP